jgi:hypothetical protein
VPASFTQGAPPPDTDASAEITQQTQAADQSEQEVASAGPAADSGAGPAAAPPPPPATIALGQTVDQVTASMGTPTRIVDLGIKKIYIYKDMKVTFKSGKVSDVQ